MASAYDDAFQGRTARMMLTAESEPLENSLYIDVGMDSPGPAEWRGRDFVVQKDDSLGIWSSNIQAMTIFPLIDLDRRRKALGIGCHY